MHQKRILFVSPPLAGHTNQLIVLAEELASRGHCVAFANSEMFRDRITRAGAEFLLWDPESSGTDPALVERFHSVWERASRETNVIRGESTMWDVGVDLYPPLFHTLSPIFKRYGPDLVIADSAGLAGMDLAAQAGVPCIIIAQFLGGHVPIPGKYPRYGTPFGINMTLGQRIRNRLHPFFAIYYFASIIKRLNRYRRDCLGADHRKVFRQKHLMLVCTAFGVEHPRPTPPLVQMVGPMIPKQIEPLSLGLQNWIDSEAKTSPVVFMSFGTLATLDRRQAGALVEGLAGDEFRVLWSLRKSQHEILPSLPKNFRLETFVSQQAVLAHPNVRAFVSHCGMNSVSESLYSGKPILALPIFGDQHYNAARITDRGVALKLSKDSFTAQDVRQSIGQLLRDPGYTSKAERMGIVLRKASGLQRAADAAEIVLGAGIDHLLPPK